MDKKITKEQVLHTAKLAKLKINDDEMENLTEKLSGILESASKLEEIDTENIEPLSHVLEVENVTRADVIKPGLTIDEALKNAPDKEGRCFKVPKVL